MAFCVFLVGNKEVFGNAIKLGVRDFVRICIETCARACFGACETPGVRHY